MAKVGLKNEVRLRLLRELKSARAEQTAALVQLLFQLRGLASGRKAGDANPIGAGCPKRESYRAWDAVRDSSTDTNHYKRSSYVSSATFDRGERFSISVAYMTRRLPSPMPALAVGPRIADGTLNDLHNFTTLHNRLRRS